MIKKVFLTSKLQHVKIKKMPRKHLILLLIIAAVLIGATYMVTTKNNKQQVGTEQTPQVSFRAKLPQKEVVVRLEPKNNSGQSGIALFKQTDQTYSLVTIELKGGASNSAQPAQIRLGFCSELSDVKFRLNDIVEGKSVTTIESTIEEIYDSLPLAVSVGRSLSQPDNSTACGDISLN